MHPELCWQLTLTPTACMSPLCPCACVHACVPACAPVHAFLQVFHWLVEDRVDYIEVTPSVSRLAHVRIVSFLLVLLVRIAEL